MAKQAIDTTLPKPRSEPRLLLPQCSSYTIQWQYTMWHKVTVPHKYTHTVFAVLFVDTYRSLSFSLFHAPLWFSLRVLPRERTRHNKPSLPTTQETTLYMDITRWSIPKSHWLYSSQPKDGEALLPNSDLKWRKEGKPLGHSGMT